MDAPALVTDYTEEEGNLDVNKANTSNRIDSERNHNGKKSTSPSIDTQFEATSVLPLTKKQKQVLDFITEYISREGYAPLIDEIKNAIDVASNATVYEHLVELQKRNYIKREPYKARAITLIQNNDTQIKVSMPSLSHAPNTTLEIAKHALSKASTFEQAYRMLLLANVLDITRARSISLYLITEQDDQLLLVPEIWQGCWQENQSPRIFVRGKGIAGYVWERRIEEFISKGNVQEDENYQSSDDPKSQSVSSIFCLPIYDLLGSVIGVINLDSNIENRFSKYRGIGRKIKTAMREISDCKYLNSNKSIEIYLWLLQTFLSTV